MNIQDFISKKITEIVFNLDMNLTFDPQVRQCNDIKFGDYQANGVISISKKLKQSPILLAKKIAMQLELHTCIKKIELSPQGFINIFLDHQWIEGQIDYMDQASHLGIKSEKNETIIIDYSSPNVAKEMHVGHMRSTVIGDCIARTLEFLGHRVIRANHIGDWGTSFGIIIAWIKLQKKEKKTLLFHNIEKIYCDAKKKFDTDKKFASKVRKYVVKLQNEDKNCLHIWKKLVDISLKKNQKVYNLLNVTLQPKHIMGESLYKHMLPDIVKDLKQKGIAHESAGATVVFLDKYKNKKGQPLGFLIQKKDGGYLYATTDIACVKYRFENFQPNRILYFVDARQHEHFKKVWSIAQKANYIPKSVQLKHYMFGMVLNKNGHPFKTREGNTVKLISLLNEAITRASKFITEKKPNISSKELKNISKCIGIGAIKYADLSKKRTSNYIFDWNQMLHLNGNTAPYIQYAYTRIQSILKKSDILEKKIFLHKVNLKKDQEIQLAIRLLQFEETIIAVSKEAMPHIMCNYLYELSVLFSKFYENFLIFSSNKLINMNRLKLVHLTGKIIKQGLNMLGIETTNKM